MYPSKYTETPDYYPVNAYDAVFMIVEGIKAMCVSNKPGDLQMDRDKLMYYMAALRDFNGVASRGFNCVGDGVKDVHVFEIKGGHWVPIKK
jgi:hypothetical protein